MDILEKVIIEPFEKFFDKVLQFLPNFLASMLILIIGIFFALILKGIFSRLFRAIGVDKIMERSGTVELLAKGGIKDPVSSLIAKLIQWITIVIFAIISLRTLEAPAVENLLEKFVLYLPNIFVALLILVFGYFLSNFSGRTVLIASVNAGLKISGLLAKFVKLTVFVLAATMALEQLGIGRETVIIAFAIVFGGVVLALSLAFGLGGRDIAKEYIEKKLREDEKTDDISHL